MIIKFNKSFYKEDVITEAINDFKKVSTGKIIKKENNEIIIEIIPNEEHSNFKEEFSNYVLGLMKNNTHI